MKIFALAPLLLGTLAWANSYSTSFPATENPISENGVWVNGGTVGTNWHNCATNTGFAFGTQPGTVKFDDSICVLTGSWGPNQTASITIKVNSNNASQFGEAEVHINTTIVAGSIKGYEGNCSVINGQSYMQIVRWDGPIGSFSNPPLNGTSTTCLSGDVLTLTRAGSNLTLTQKRGSTTVATTTAIDSTYVNGSPGMGFYIENPTSSATAANAAFGATNFTATDGVTGGGTNPCGTAAHCVNLSWTPQTGGTDPTVSYNLYKATGITGFSKLTSLTGATTAAYLDLAVTAGSSYSYYLTSVDSAGVESVPSSTASTTVPGGTPQAPLPPTGLKAVAQ